MRYRFMFAYLVIFSTFFCDYLLGLEFSSEPLTLGFSQRTFVSEQNLEPHKISEPEKEKKLKTFCQKLQKEYSRYGWSSDPCSEISWQADFMTAKGDPLIYTVFGSGSNTTLFLGGVHPDEITPIPISFRLIKFLKENPQYYEKKDYRIVVAPLVCPDGFFLDKPSRTNGRVDVNRNFLTHDWYTRQGGALDSWRTKRGAQERYFPGFFPNTEIETVFQTHLISQFEIKKIFTLHAPLGFYDFDGPGDQKSHHTTEAQQRTKEFVLSLSEKSHNYKIVVYNVYPGSLGNYAGKERKIPTITLELETTTPTMVDYYWKKFLPGFLHSISYHFPKNGLTQK